MKKGRLLKPFFLFEAKIRIIIYHNLITSKEGIRMSDSSKADIPLGVPFMGGSDDPSPIIGCESEDGGTSQDGDEDGPGV
jgi:hypothetical protein